MFSHFFAFFVVLKMSPKTLSFDQGPITQPIAVSHQQIGLIHGVTNNRNGLQWRQIMTNYRLWPIYIGYIYPLSRRRVLIDRQIDVGCGPL